MKAPELIDVAIGGRVLVYGSLPPGGRDLDLLVRPSERQAIAACLTDNGFVCREDQWARFAACTVELVELADTATWGLSAEVLDALFGESLPIDGLSKVTRPCPHHELLILARRIVAGKGVLDAKRRTRLEQSLADDPDAFQKARERAGKWNARRALDALEDAWRTDAPVPAQELTYAQQELRAIRPPSKREQVARLIAPIKRLPRPGRGSVVAFSGLDGAGKSSQALALVQTLELLGYDAVVVRTRITWDDLLWTLAGPIKRLLTPPLRLLSARRPAQAERKRSIAREQPVQGDDEQNVYEQAAPPDPVTMMREASSLLTGLWTLIITLANAYSQWKLMRRQLMRGGIVICDRYTLDSIVELHYSYGTEQRFRGARAALSLLYPKPVRAFFLDVPPQAALERKGEWGIQWLSEHRDLYLQECERSDVRLLDGERSQADLCAEVAREVWLSGI